MSFKIMIICLDFFVLMKIYCCFQIPQWRTVAQRLTRVQACLVRGRQSSSMGAAQSSPEAADMIETAIKSDCVVVFSKTTCGFCRMAKETLNSAGAEYTAIELNQRKDGGDIQDALYQKTGSSTVSE